MEEVVTFNKSLQDRLRDYSIVFGRKDFTSVRNIKEEWTFYLQLTMDPAGWQAVWKIPRLKCESLKIPFPSYILVLVIDTNFVDLLSTVRVIAVQDDICIPDIHRVSLIQLWPTEDQDKSIFLNLQTTADTIDMMRFFYLYLFMPWDEEEAETVDWMETHLETRLRLYYDLKNGSIPRAAAEHIHSCLTQARRMQNKRKLIESQLEQEKDNEGTVSSKLLDTLKEIHVDMMYVRTEIEIAENPVFRDVLIKRYTEVELKENKENQFWIVYDEGTADDYIQFLEKVKDFFPSQTFRVSTNLSLLLGEANPQDTFILNESKHSIRNAGVLEEGGAVKGIGSRDKIILTSKIDDTMLDFNANSVVLENITIDAHTAQCALLVRKGTITLKDCKIIGDKSLPTTHQGIIVLSGAKLVLINCEITAFFMAIVGNSGAAIVMNDCCVHDVSFGMKFFDNCVVNIKKTSFNNCEEHGIVLETDKYKDAVGNFQIIDRIPNVNLESVTGVQILKGDAAITPTPKLKPLEDLFSNPDFNPTIIESGDDDYSMNCSQTVIEDSD